LTAGELGLPGLFLFMLLWVRWFQVGATFLRKRSRDPMVRLGAGFFFCICGIFLQSLTEWAYRQTHIFFTFNVILGTMASLYYLRRKNRRRQAEEAELEEEEECHPVHTEVLTHQEA
jgi:Flp pilus assembly protein TadB